MADGQNEFKMQGSAFAEPTFIIQDDELNVVTVN
jgi:hypothetical protein